MSADSLERLAVVEGRRYCCAAKHHLGNSASAMTLPKPVRTHGLTHFAIAVRDPRRSLEFYRAVLGVVAIYEDDSFIQAQTPGSRDVLVFERKARTAGKRGGVVHFGFRLTRAADIERARAAIRGAGGTITDTGEFVPGEPYVFFRDPDGYEVEIWYELPTALDPPTRRHTRNRKAPRA